VTAPTSQPSWDDAIAYCQLLEGLGGGWRLPSIKELVTLMQLPTENDQQSTLPPLFANEAGSEYWSATPELELATKAYFVAFGYGYGTEKVGTDLMGYSKRVRCVRP
jgi:hypothetical protein